MRLEDVAVFSMIGSVNDDIGANGAFDFFTTTGYIPTTGMLNTGTRLTCGNPAMNTTGTSTVGGIITFNAIGTDTAVSTGNAQYFALFNTTATNPTTGDIIFTGSVGVTTADITFNTTDWDAGDNISITSLTFTQPYGTAGAPDQ